MPGTKRYSAEARERAVRLYFDHRAEFSSDRAAIDSIAEKFAIQLPRINLTRRI